MNSSESSPAALSASSRIKLLAGVAVLAIVGYFLYNQAAPYSHLSNWHVVDLMRAKAWSILWLLVVFAVTYWKRKSPVAPYLVLIGLSAYFVVLYGVLFRGTEYGMNGHWGDNGNRIAYVFKMMAYNTIFTDWFLKDLPAFYPPFWFALMAIYAKVIGIEAYQTVKFGYLLIFLIYPWLLYWSWRKVVSRTAATAVAVATVFFAYKYLDWIYYEHMTAALFLPWWLYYFEGEGSDLSLSLKKWRFYVAGAVFGGILFMTYYYWYFMAAAALPLTLVIRYCETRSFRDTWFDLRHKIVLMAGVAVVSAVFWLPLLVSLFQHGMNSAQSVWFGTRHANLTLLWPDLSLEAILILAGLFFSVYLFRQWERARLPYLFLGGLFLIIIDRLLNINDGSFQSRKLIEFVHVFAMAPLAIGVVSLFEKKTLSPNVQRGLVGLLLVAGLITTNAHTEIYHTEKYKNALKQRVPVKALAAFKDIDTYNRVILTNNIQREQCYLPNFLFIPENNMSCHTAGRYAQREEFLKAAAKITEPDMLAYALRYNRYDAVDYVYLDVDKETDKLYQRLYQVRFNQKAVVNRVFFEWDYRIPSEFLVKKNDYNMFEVVAPGRSSELDQLLSSRYPDVVAHLTD